MGPGQDAAAFPASMSGWTKPQARNSRAVQVRVIEVPAHTRGPIAFEMDGTAFTGDTLFAMGCGRLFEGDPPTMWASLSKLMRVPDPTKIYCGHEYTEAMAASR